MELAETTSLFQWIKRTKIEIPMLQRDYAQGRPDARTKALREKFIGDLCAAIEKVNSTKKEALLHLDFIYGPKKDGVFQPLDGQQRLTTLFLLHWYIATKAGQLPEVASQLKNFRYKVRVTTQEFIDALLNPGHFEKDKEPTFKNLRDARWYYSAWDFDPSVQGMLQMIESIDKELSAKSLEEFLDLWKTLTKKDSPITFTVLPMEEYGLGDKLYMRMNARGLPLTDFENFKAWLQGHCAEKEYSDEEYFYNGDEETKKNSRWTHKIDREWTPLIWKHSDKPNEDDFKEENGFDTNFIRFFNAMAIAFSASETEEDSKKKEREWDPKRLEKLIEDVVKGKPILTNRYPEAAFEKDSLITMFNLLDILCKQPDLLTTGFDGKELCSLEMLTDEAKRKTIILAYAIALFVKNIGDKFSEGSCEFKHWKRVIRNLVENTDINTERFIDAIQSVDILWEKTKDNGGNILVALASDEKIKLSTFTEPFKEERIKARLLWDGTNSRIRKDWEEAIEEIENQGFFRGQIGVLIDFENKDLLAFKSYAQKAAILFSADEKGTIKTQTLLQQALLAQGDYLRNVGCSRYTFCKDRSEWMRYFDEGKRSVLKDLMDALIKNFDIEPVEKSLRDFTTKKLNDGSCSDWRRFFVAEPRCIKMCKEGRASFENCSGIEDVNIRLLKTTQRKGGQAELRTYYAYLSLIKGRESDFSPFEPINIFYWESSNSSQHPCIAFKNWTPPGGGKPFHTLDIRFNKKGKYEFIFFVQNQTNLDPRILEKIKDLGFSGKEEEADKYRKEIELNDQFDQTPVIEEIKKLCSSLDCLS